MLFLADSFLDGLSASGSERRAAVWFHKSISSVKMQVSRGFVELLNNGF